MRTHLTRWMAACGLVVAALTAPFAVAQEADEPKPVAVVAFAGYEELMKDLDFIGELGDQKGASDMADQFIQMFTQGKGLAGFDKTKPIGLLLYVDSGMPGGALCLPVSDLNALLDVAKGFGVTTTDVGDGVMQVKTPQGASAFIKESGKWALVSLAPAMLAVVPEDPGSLFAPLVKDYDLSAKLFTGNLPQALHEQLVEGLTQGAQQNLKKESDESEEEFAARKKLVDAQIQQMKEFVEDLNEVTLGLKIDESGKKALLDFAYTAYPDTKLAKQVNANNKVATNFAGFVKPEAAVSVAFASAENGLNEAQISQMIDAARTRIGAEIEKTSKIKNDASKAKAKEALDAFLAAAKATIDAGTTDGGASLELGDNSLSLVIGSYVADSQKVLEGLKKYAEVETTELPQVDLDAESVGDVKFHNVTYKIPADNEKAKELLTENGEMIVGVGKNAVYFALGSDPLAAAKKAIEASAKSPNKPIPPYEVSVGLKQILQFAKSIADDDQKPLIENLSDAVDSAGSDADHIRVIGEPLENGIRTRLELEEGVLKAIGKGASQARMQGAGAPGGPGF